MARTEASDDRGLGGKNIFVTGAGSGIGRAIAEKLALAGGNLSLFDLDGEQLEAVAAPLRARGAQVLCHSGDVVNSADLARAIKATVPAYGTLDGAVNCAGIVGATAGFLEYPEEIYRRVLDVNVMGVANSMRAELAVMDRQGFGSVVNIASAAGIIGWVAHSAYVVSKHAVVGLTKTVALEFAPRGIRINSVCPAFIYTALTAELFKEEGVHDAAVAGHPIGRIGQPEEVAEAVMWLLSSRSSFAVGSSLVLDGGSTID